ncbi:MAG: hypothetical protein IH946_12135 [Bacteroidetes bacterium]|nr:hypothetical protein [Bacteroidota bacterium]
MEVQEFNIIDVTLYLTYILIVVATGAAIIFPIYFLVTNPKKSLKGMIFLGVLLLILAISYGIAQPTEVYNTIGDKLLADGGISRFAGMTLITGYILLAAGFLGLVYSEISNFFR